jgi:hypothetical protein
MSASPTAPIGSYSVSLTAVANSTVAGNAYSITHTTATTTGVLTVYVVGQSTALTLAEGATGTVNPVFNTAAAAPGATLLSFACGKVVTSAGGSVAKAVISCTDTNIPAGGVPVGTGSNPANTALTTVPIQISLATTTEARLNKSNAVSLAALLGIPLLALMGWMGSRKSPRRNFFRFIGLILLLVGASYAGSGCGGSFTQTGGEPNTGGLAPGSYLVQVVAYDGAGQTGNKYYAVVPLTVNSNNASQ